MSVCVHLLGRLGNNLFQYVFARLLAEQHGFALDCLQEPWVAHEFLGRRFDQAPHADLSGFLPHFPDLRLKLPGKRCAAPVQAHEFRTFEEWDGHTVDLGALQHPGARRIVLRGFFERAEYYAPHLDRIRAWLRFVPAPTPLAIGPRDVLVNLRRGLDMALVERVLALDYYRRALHELPDVGRVHVCGTGLDGRARAALAEFDPLYHDGSPHEHFSFLMRFRRVVLSNSTFCWWAAVLSPTAEELHAPSSNVPGVDLRLPGPRYRERPASYEVFRPFVFDPARAHEALACLPPARAAFGDWLLAQREPLAARELYLHYLGPARRRDAEPEFQQTLGHLLGCGALRVNPECEELR